MNCEDARKLVSAHVDGELRDDRRWDLEDHLRECAACRREADGMRHMASLLTSALPSFPPTLPDRILESLPERSHPQIVSLRWAAVAAAAIIPILILIYSQITTDPGEVPVTPVTAEPALAKVGEVEGVKLALEDEEDVDWAEVRHGNIVENTSDVPALLTMAGGSAEVAIDAGTRIEVRDEPGETVITILGDGKVLADLDASRLQKRFVVEAASGDGRVRATALGTVFEVERREGKVEVRVLEGKVQVVDSGARSQQIVPGKTWRDDGPVDLPPTRPAWTDPAIDPETLPRMDLPVTPRGEGK
jgi:ferric-dicitrate binding protein FerR (iron transport regulator)